MSRSTGMCESDQARIRTHPVVPKPAPTRNCGQPLDGGFDPGSGQSSAMMATGRNQPKVDIVPIIVPRDVCVESLYF